MKASALREQTDEELENLRRERRKEIADLKIRKKVGSAENPLRLRMLRRELARIETVIRERELKRNA
ncbi:MAG: 50S ribosomal protein L29 [Kiritimatiellae bacterium]|nr:50S ribosomal protein L29 [Kiritimatiellia bacterium]